ncbi:unnamed protein product [Amoebophrya sp. A120]|nr:unnamed protein product [Amoebophrya sp. A120]|eukprot:GSA120T00004308001.1
MIIAKNSRHSAMSGCVRSATSMARCYSSVCSSASPSASSSAFDRKGARSNGRSSGYQMALVPGSRPSLAAKSDATSLNFAVRGTCSRSNVRATDLENRLLSTNIHQISKRSFARKSDSPPPSSPPPPAAPPADPWQEVKDPAGSGKTYWWNTQTNQVTPLGASKPLATQQQQTTAPAAPSAGGGLMGAIADGMAFGFGSSLMHRAMDSVMGPRTMEVTHTQEGQTPPPDAPPSPPPASGDDAGGSYFQEESSWFGGGDGDGGGGGWFDE